MEGGFVVLPLAHDTDIAHAIPRDAVLAFVEGPVDESDLLIGVRGNRRLCRAQEKVAAAVIVTQAGAHEIDEFSESWWSAWPRLITASPGEIGRGIGTFKNMTGNTPVDLRSVVIEVNVDPPHHARPVADSDWKPLPG